MQKIPEEWFAVLDCELDKNMIMSYIIALFLFHKINVISII